MLPRYPAAEHKARASSTSGDVRTEAEIGGTCVLPKES